MAERRFRFKFPPKTKMDEVLETLSLAVMACEGIFGFDRVCCEIDLDVDAESAACTITTTNVVGLVVVCAYVGLLKRELGESGFDVDAIGA